jgi:hypothetical protein
MATETTRFRQGKQGMACRYRMAVGLITPRSGRYGKERRAGRQEGCRAGVVSSPPPPGRYGKERRAGRQEGCRAGRYGGGLGYQQDGTVKEVLAVGSLPPAQASTARKGERAGRRAARQVGTGWRVG